MNCKADQMAWIVVPPPQCRRGIEQLNGRIVRTVALLSLHPEPIWEVTPTQTVTITLDCKDPYGAILHAGDTAVARGIPDSYLRPFDPNSEREAQPTQRELEAVS